MGNGRPAVCRALGGALRYIISVCQPGCPVRWVPAAVASCCPDLPLRRQDSVQNGTYRSDATSPLKSVCKRTTVPVLMCSVTLCRRVHQTGHLLADQESPDWLV